MQSSKIIPENPDDIVITGISGSFPKSNSVVELEENLRNRLNLIEESSKDSSFSIGCIPNKHKFDASYFGITPDYADAMDPMARILLEKTYEAIFDSGYNPESLRRKKIGVFIGVYLSECEIAYFSSGTSEGLAITGIVRSFLANRVSYSFGFHGPSFCVDTACSSGLHALHLAYQAIKNGDCESAIVGGCNLCLNDAITATMLKLGVLSPEGKARVLDERSGGYCRSEAVCSIFLQKRKHARRIYAHVVHVKINCDGFKAEGITYPSHVMQKQLLKEFYEECQVLPETVDWIELHATGTRAGDREEIEAVEILCENRVTPLKVGSVKSNMGHAEAASALCAIAKAIIAMKSGAIPANINYKTPRNDIDALHNGLIEVITEETPWKGGLVALNSFGLGGANGHTLLKSNTKSKESRQEFNLPRLIVASGRTEEAVDTILTNVKKDTSDVELVGLLHEIFSEDIIRHLYRGYTVLYPETNKSPLRKIENCPIIQRPVWFLFAGMGCQWPGMGKSLMSLPIFARSIEQCHEILKIKNVDLIRIITREDSTIFDNVLNSFVGITAMQIALVDVLKTLNVMPFGLVGHSVGEIACAYADGCLSLEQTILCAYYRGLAVLETNNIEASMAAVGLSYEELSPQLPPEIDIACRNSPNNCTISGPSQCVKELINTFQNQNIFAREISCANIAFHSRYIQHCGPVLLKYLEEIIPEPKLRSEKWITSSVSTADIQTEDAKYCSATYQTNNLLNPVLFEDAVKQISENAIVVEVSPHSLLAAISKPSLKSQSIYVPLSVRNCSDGIDYLLQALGQLYLAGKSLKLQNLYPTIEYPVSNQAPMLAPLVRWQHNASWRVVYASKEEMVPGERRITVYPNGKEHSYLLDHIIDGRNIFPGFGLVQLVWETVALIHSKNIQDCSIIFEKLRFHRMVHVNRHKNLHFIIHVQKGSGNFEISEGGLVVVTGKVTVPESDDYKEVDMPWIQQFHDSDEDPETELNSEDIYQELTIRGYGYAGLHKQLLSCNVSGTKARARWNDNWPTFFDSMAQVFILQTDSRDPYLLASIEKLVVNTKRHRECLENVGQNSGLLMKGDRELDILECGGVLVKGIKGHVMPRRKLQKEPQLLTQKFTPYIEPENITSMMEFSCFSSCILWQNILSTSLKMVEFNRSDKEFVSVYICECLNAYAHIQASSIIVTTNSTSDQYREKLYLKFQQEPVTDGGQHLIIIDTPYEQILEESLQTLADGGFIMVRADITEKISHQNLNVCAEVILNDEKLTLLRHMKRTNETEETICVKITAVDFEWICQLQKEINSQKETILYAEQDSINGVLGFYNCLRKELPNNKIRCFFIFDQNAPPFSLAEPFYRSQLDKNLNVNVFRDNKWGCYVHYTLAEIPLAKRPHAFVKVGRTGDLRTLNWYQGNVNPSLNNQEDRTTSTLIHIYYSAINFKDVLLATGVLSYEKLIKNRIMQECLIGCEFSGRDNEGKRYMGIYPAGAISTVISASKLFLWQIPENWSLEDAATVPVIYLTVISAFFVHGNLKRGESVLIHSGAGGVGQAAINIAIRYECNIFTTVGTPEKREFIKSQFPQIKDNHIGTSRDTSFEYLILKETNGKGVNLVLNSLAEDKLQASVRCLAKGGRFLEIGKLDLLRDNNLGMQIFLKGISFHCILLDYIHEEEETKRNAILQHFQHELDTGSIKPIVRNVFKDDEIEDAFRFMGTGKHIGKVLIKIRSEETDITTPPTILLKEAIPRFTCDAEKVYIIVGGLGGMGMELADWLVLRGAKTLILTSRSNNTTGYQQMRLKLWKSYGVTAIISNADISNQKEVHTLLTHAEYLGSVAAIFNLAGITEDKLFENLDPENFKLVMSPKANATLLLDHISRKICPNLQYFVIFSSVSSGFGNTGQTNYGFTNSVCERICEKRYANGFPALVIQWGAVDDVGMMKNLNNVEKIFGLKKQPIRSCLQVMDTLLNQPEIIVTSFITADKNTDTNNSTLNLMQSVASILGIRDLKMISMYSPLPELGMDSITGLEIKNTLEQQHDIFLSPKEIMALTFAQLEKIQKEGKIDTENGINENNCTASIPYIKRMLFTNPKSFDLSNLEPVIQLSDESIESPEDIIFLFPATDGLAASMKCLASRLKGKIMCFQYHNHSQMESLEKQAEFYATIIKNKLPPETEFKILAYSYGVILAMEVMKILTSQKIQGNAILIDGSIEFVHSLKQLYFGSSSNLEDFQTKIIIDVVKCFHSSTDTAQFQKELRQLQSWEEKLNLVQSRLPENTVYGKDNLRIIMNYLYHKYRTLRNYHFHLDDKLAVEATILKANKLIFPVSIKMDLEKNFTTTPAEYSIDENHFTILDSEKTADIVNCIFEKKQLKNS